jgi:MFS family permease
VTAEPRPAKRLHRNVRLFGLASLLNDIASEMVVPLLPGFLLKVLHGSVAWLGAIEGLADSASSLVKLGSGVWSDRVRSRKWLVVPGYAIAAIARPIIGLLTLPWQLMGVRIADRAGKGIRTPPRDAMIVDCTPPEIRGRAFGFQRAMDHLGAVIGPLLAAAFLLYRPDDLRGLFLWTLLPGLAVVGLLWFGLREQAAPAKPAAKLTWTLKPFDRNFRFYLLALLVFTLGNSSDMFLLVRAEEMGVPRVQLPLLWCVFHLAKSGGNLLAGRAVDRFGPGAMILAGWMVYAAVYLAFALASAAWQVWALFLVYALFYALTEPAEKTLVANLVGHQHRGLAFGWYHFAVGIAALPASLVFGWIYQLFGAFAAFGWGASLAMVAAVMLMGVRKR